MWIPILRSSRGLLPLRKRLPVHSQRLPVLWTTGDATIFRRDAISWRTRKFFSELIDDFISPFQRVQNEPRINENELIALGHHGCGMGWVVDLRRTYPWNG